MQASDSAELPRRDFVKSGSIAALLAALGGVPITGDEPPKNADPKADPNAQEKPAGPPVKFGVIGLGAQGREILTQLGRLPNAPVTAICDSYKASLKRASEAAPDAQQLTDYRAVLESPDVQAVVIATPTPLHKEIVLAALQSGKHVYLEAPMAHSIEDGRAIARAAQGIPAKQIFQVGLQFRENPQHHHVLKFFRTGACGKTATASAQFNKKQSWRRASPNAEREKALNWRLDNDTSLGLVGEIGIHPMDCASWYQDALPTAVTGFGGIQLWEDGRQTPDTVQAVLDYPGGVRLVFASTLASSYGGEQQVFNGSDATILIRDNKGWMFKEADAPLLGWEVYARKDDILSEMGIALVANATKILAQGKKPAEAASDTDSPLKYALEKFVEHVNEGTPPAAGWKVGFESLVTVVKANEAVLKGGRVTYEAAMFQV
ncbi:MAG: Gfo/Idh/MocA family oxidoreductase [Verrucomicrobiae bacterium]|nr:Gfo/Idh/MocA family oxidoreductase [Verrucomicrobiae bacterium]